MSLPRSSMVRNRRIFPLLSLRGPLLAFFAGNLESLFLIGGGLNSIRNADFFFPLETDASFVLMDILDLFEADCSAAVCIQVVATNATHRLHTSIARNLVELFQ